MVSKKNHKRSSRDKTKQLEQVIPRGVGEIGDSAVSNHSGTPASTQSVFSISSSETVLPSSGNDTHHHHQVPNTEPQMMEIDESQPEGVSSNQSLLSSVYKHNKFCEITNEEFDARLESLFTKDTLYSAMMNCKTLSQGRYKAIPMKTIKNPIVLEYLDSQKKLAESMRLSFLMRCECFTDAVKKVLAREGDENYQNKKWMQTNNKRAKSMVDTTAENSAPLTQKVQIAERTPSCDNVELCLSSPETDSPVVPNFDVASNEASAANPSSVVSDLDLPAVVNESIESQLLVDSGMNSKEEIKGNNNQIESNTPMELADFGACATLDDMLTLEDDKSELGIETEKTSVTDHVDSGCQENEPCLESAENLNSSMTQDPASSQSYENVPNQDLNQSTVEPLEDIFNDISSSSSSNSESSSEDEEMNLPALPPMLKMEESNSCDEKNISDEQCIQQIRQMEAHEAQVSLAIDSILEPVPVAQKMAESDSDIDPMNDNALDYEY